MIERSQKSEFQNKFGNFSDIIETLRLIGELKSINKVAKELNIPYSTLWTNLAKFESLVNKKLVISDARGSRLTKYAKMLLSRFSDPYHKFAGSNDPLAEKILNALNFDVTWQGSAGGLAFLMLDFAKVAGSHLYDKASNGYNVPFLKNFWLENKVIVLRGYIREIGIVYKRIKFRNIEDIRKRRNIRVVGRNVGSATRFLLKEVFPNFRFVKNVYAHEDVAKMIAEGYADAGIAIRHAALEYDLNFYPLKKEIYDFIIIKDSSRCYKIARKIGRKIKGYVDKFEGYVTHKDSGKIIYP